MKQFKSIEMLDTGILYSLELASSISVLLLAFGLIASMANVLTKGAVLTDHLWMQQVWAWTQCIAIDASVAGTIIRTFRYSGRRGESQNLALRVTLPPAPVVFLDLDHSFDRVAGTIKDPQAAAIVEKINSYTEVSPGGTGLHVLAYAKLPGKGIPSTIEMYGQNRFTTITTDHLDGTPKTLEQRQEAIAALYRQCAPPVVPDIIQNTRFWGGAQTSLPNSRKRQRVIRCYNAC